jgi:hypothetical protein
MDFNFHKSIIIGSAHVDVLWGYMWFWAFVFNHILKLLKGLVSRHHFSWKYIMCEFYLFKEKLKVEPSKVKGCKILLILNSSKIFIKQIQAL